MRAARWRNSATLGQAKTTLSQTDSSLAKVQDKLATAANDIAALQTSESMGELADLMGVDVNDVADFMASPVELTSKSIYPVKSFGSGIAPFYTNLALWVGGYVLIAIYKLEVDREGVGSFTARQGYFGRWLLMVILGALQAIIVTVGDLVIGVQCVSPLLFVLGGIAISFTYVNIIYALSTTFKHIGKAIGVILVIVQIPGSSGMYPIEMMPGFFQWLHLLLPFTYGINLLRETVGGMYSFNYLFNLCILGVFLIVALFIGLQLRPLLLNLNLLFDKQLSTTGMMICESNDLPRQRYRCARPCVSCSIPIRTVANCSIMRSPLNIATRTTSRAVLPPWWAFRSCSLSCRRFSISTITARSSCLSFGSSRLLPSAAGLSISSTSARASTPRCASRRFRMRTCAARCASTRPPFRPLVACSA